MKKKIYLKISYFFKQKYSSSAYSLVEEEVLVTWLHIEAQLNVFDEMINFEAKDKLISA